LCKTIYWFRKKEKSDFGFWTNLTMFNEIIVCDYSLTSWRYTKLFQIRYGQNWKDKIQLQRKREIWNLNQRRALFPMISQKGKSGKRKKWFDTLLFSWNLIFQRYWKYLLNAWSSSIRYSMHFLSSKLLYNISQLVEDI
jgi:hypothetical protein